jgi:hypothetical protein
MALAAMAITSEESAALETVKMSAAIQFLLV